MQLVKSKIVLLITVCIIISFIFYKYEKNKLEINFDWIQYKCHQNIEIKAIQECLNNKILTMTSSEPNIISPLFIMIENKYNDHTLNDPLQVYSPILHEIGMQLVLNNPDKDPKDLLKYCPMSLRGGCVHGVIMEYIDNNKIEINNKETIKNLCGHSLIIKGEKNINQDLLYQNCIHAIGHEIVAQNKLSLNEYLYLCDRANRNDYMNRDISSSCIYGVLMEYSKGEYGLGRHSESPVGSIILSCDQVEDKFKRECYISIGFYRQYEAYTELKEDTINLCNTYKSPYNEYCKEGVGGAY